MLSCRPLLNIHRDVVPRLPREEIAWYTRERPSTESSRTGSRRTSLGSGPRSRRDSTLSTMSQATIYYDASDEYAQTPGSGSRRESSIIPAFYFEDASKSDSLHDSDIASRRRASLSDSSSYLWRVGQSLLKKDEPVFLFPVTEEEAKSPRSIDNASLRSSLSEGSMRRHKSFQGEASDSRSNHSSGLTEEMLDEFDTNPMEELRISLIARRPDGTVIFARDVKDQVSGVFTELCLFHPEERLYAQLYQFREAVFLTSASLSPENNLLAFTTASRNFIDDTYEDMYESSIVDVSKNGLVLMKTKKTPELQRLEFLDQHYFLFIQDKEFIYVYQVASLIRLVYEIRTKCKNPRQTLAPSKIISKKHIWFEWKPIRNILYVLHSTSEKHFFQNSRLAVEQEYILQGYRFIDPPHPELILETSLQLTIPRLAKKPLIYIGSNHTPLLWMSGRSSPDLMMTIVEMKSGLHLCRQELLDTGHTSFAGLRCSIFILNRRSLLNVSIPIYSIETSALRKTHVFFGAISDQLLLYIPGQYFQLLDCGFDHACSEGLVFSDKEETSFDVMSDWEGCPRLLAPCGILKTSSRDVNDFESYDSCFIDTYGNTIYEYYLNRETILSLFQHENTDFHVKALHLAITHLQDQELVEQIVMKVCQEHPENFTPELIKEYLIAFSYQNVKEMKMPLHLLRLLPISSITPLVLLDDPVEDLVVVKSRPLYSISYSPMKPSGIFSFSTSQPRSEYQRLVLETLAHLINPTSADPQNARQGGLRALVRKVTTLLKYDENIKASFERLLVEETTGAITRQQFFFILVDHFLTSYPKETKNSHWAKEYCTSQALSIYRLYKCVQSAISRRTANRDSPSNASNVMLFKLLEAILYVIEEISFPVPQDFRTQFSMLAMTCLPMTQLYQYLRRGVVFLPQNLRRSIVIGEFRPSCPGSLSEAFRNHLIHTVNSLDEALGMVEYDEDRAEKLITLAVPCLTESMLANVECQRDLREALEEITETGKEFVPLSTLAQVALCNTEPSYPIIVSKYIHLFAKHQSAELDLQDRNRPIKFCPPRSQAEVDWD